MAEGVAAAVRRMSRDREPRVLVYDAAGHARLLQPGSRGQAQVLRVAERMVELVKSDAETAPGEAA